MFKRLLFSLSVVSLIMSGCATVQTTQPESKSEKKPVQSKVYKEAIIETSKGTIVFEFYNADAPKSVANFAKLANQKFYDGLTWHRVEPGFVIQGGCPKGDGTGGPGYTIDAEFNSRNHLTGTVAMARAMDPNSAGSQFYICLGKQPFLDGKYTVFGQVTQGMDVVKTIRRGDLIKKVTVK